MCESVRLIAFYLPQFHPIPENDEWWGKGFTEWTNVAKAVPLFHGHHQPNIPADLGFYDLRVAEVREAQAQLARAYNIEGFCYYHYWFGGKRLLERPFNEVLKMETPKFPFCLCWANETWTGVWHGAPNRVLIEQTYPGSKDHEEHFKYLLRAFTDSRYMKIDGKPIFLIYEPTKLPDSKRTIDYWKTLAVKNGLKDLYIIGMAVEPWAHNNYGYDAILPRNLHLAKNSDNGFGFRIKNRMRILMGRPRLIYSYEKALNHLLTPNASKIDVHPCVIPNWDNTPRSGLNGFLFNNSTPELFKKHLKQAIAEVIKKPENHRLIFIKSWNEWAEGNYLEPDLRYGHAYLEMIKEALKK